MIVSRTAAGDVRWEDVPPPVAADWPTPRTILVGAAALGSAAMLPVPLYALGLVEETRRIAPFAVLFTMYCAVVVMRGALRAQASGNAVAWCVGGGLLAGACNAVANFLMLMLVSNGPGGLLTGLGTALLGFWMFLAFGGLPGVVVGVSFVPLLAGGRGLAIMTSRRDLPVVALWAGCWLVAVAVVVSWLLARATLTAALAAVTGVTLLVLAAASDLRLVLWLRRLASPGGLWRLAARDPQGDYGKLAALGRWTFPALCDSVLVREQPGLGPYRSTSRAEEVALVPHDVVSLARRDLRRSALALAGGLVALALLV